MCRRQFIETSRGCRPVSEQRWGTSLSVELGVRVGSRVTQRVQVRSRLRVGVPTGDAELAVAGDAAQAAVAPQAGNAALAGAAAGAAAGPRARRRAVVHHLRFSSASFKQWLDRLSKQIATKHTGWLIEHTAMPAHEIVRARAHRSTAIHAAELGHSRTVVSSCARTARAKIGVTLHMLCGAFAPTRGRCRGR